MFNSKTLSFEKNLLRKTLPIRQLACNKDFSLLAVALEYSPSFTLILIRTRMPSYTLCYFGLSTPR